MPTTPVRLVGEGDVVGVGTRRLTVVHLPGHTPGSIGLVEEATGTFFSGDAVYDGPILDFLPECDEDSYTATMRQMRTFDVRVLFGGHGPQLDRARMIGLIDCYLRDKEHHDD